MSVAVSATLPGTIVIFVAMPGTTMGPGTWDDIPEIKTNLLEPVEKRIGERLGRPTDLRIEKDKLTIRPIHRSMFEEAAEADVYIADLTGSNANVYLELGVRWALRDSVTIPIAQNVAEVKFNVSGTRVIPYGISPNVLRQAVEQITEAAVLGLTTPGVVDNPVRDGSPVVAIRRSELDDLHRQVERLLAERGDDLVQAAHEAQAESAISLLRLALDRNPHNFDAHLDLGALLIKSADYPSAISTLKNAVSIRPKSAEAWRELAVAQSRNGDLDEAEGSALRSLDLDPGNKETHANLGGVIRRRARLLADSSPEQTAELLRARSSYERAHAIERDDTYPLTNIALIDLWLGSSSPDSDETLVKLELRTRLGVMDEPNEAWKHLDRTTALALIGRRDEARQAARDAVALIEPANRTSYLTSAMAPLEDALLSSSIRPDQDAAIRTVLDELRAGLV